MAINDTKKNVLLGQSVEEQVKNIDDNFTSLFDTVDDLDYGINNSGFITKDVNNLTNYTVKSETGTDIELLLDTTNYTMTLKLKNAAGTVVSTDTIDFPIESMVVNATYASGTLTLTLQNGTTLDVDISAIISGLVPDTRTVNGKQLNANVTLTQDDVSDGTTYKRFSQAEKTKLSGISEGANKYTHPSYTARTKGLYKITVDATGHVSEVEEVGAASTTADGLMSKTDKEKLDAIDDSLKNVTADQIGKVKDVKVNGTSVLGTDGVAAITIEALKADFVSVTTTDSAWTTKTVNGTDYKAIKVEKTDTALGVFNSSGQEMVVQKVYDDSYLYLCIGTEKVACTIRKLSGGAVGTGGSGGSGGGKKLYKHSIIIYICDTEGGAQTGLIKGEVLSPIATKFTQLEFNLAAGDDHSFYYEDYSNGTSADKKRYGMVNNVMLGVFQSTEIGFYGFTTSQSKDVQAVISQEFTSGCKHYTLPENFDTVTEL